MLVLNDLDLNKLSQLRNTLMQQATVPPAQGNADFGTLGDNNVGLFCHYDGKVWYWGRTLAGPARWYSLSSSTDLPVYADPNRLVVTDASARPVSSPDFGIDAARNLSLGISGTRRRIINLDDPIDDFDAVNKRYVDSLVAGLTDFKDSCVFATIGDSGDDSSLGSGPNGLRLLDFPVGSLDTIAGPMTIGMRVLVKDEVFAQYNGIYAIIALNGYTIDLERTPDANETGELSDGTFVFVEQGTAHGRTAWVITDSGTTPVLNNDPINWVLFSFTGGVDAGDGLITIGNTIHLNPDRVTIHTVADQVAVRGATVNDRVLLTNTAGPSSSAVWGQIDLSAGRNFVTGVLPPGNGGTGINIAAAAKGSLLYTSADSVWSILPTPAGGVAGRVLMTDTGSRDITWTDTTGGGAVVRNTLPTIEHGMRTTWADPQLFVRRPGFPEDSPNLTSIEFGGGGLGTINIGRALGLGRASCVGGIFQDVECTGIATIIIGSVRGTARLTMILGQPSGGTGTGHTIFFGGGTDSEVRVLSTRLNVTGQLLVNPGTNGLLIGDNFNGRVSFNTDALTGGAQVVWTSQAASGTVAYLDNHLGQFGPTTSAQLAALLTDETGSAGGGLAVFSNNPTFLNGVTAGSVSMTVFNTGATTVTAFGAATSLTIGAATAGQTLNLCAAATATSTYNLFTGATAGANIKTINLGTNGIAGSGTNLNICNGGSGARTVSVNLANVAGPGSTVSINIGPISASGTGTMTVNTGTTLIATSPTFHNGINGGTAAFNLLGGTVNTLIVAPSCLSADFFGGATVSPQSVSFCVSNSGNVTANLFTGPTASGNTKVINLGTGGLGSSTTTIQMGSGNGGALGSVDIRLACLVFDSSTVNSFQIRNSTDSTRRATFNAASITTGTTRIFSFRDRNGTLALVEDGLGQFVIPNTLTSAQLASILTDETGTGLAVFNSGPTLTSPRVTAPLITTGLLDANGNMVLGIISAAESANYLQLEANPVSSPVRLRTAGPDANVSLKFIPKSAAGLPSTWGAVQWEDLAANTGVRTLRMCRMWSMLLSTGTADRANNALTVGATMTVSHEFGTQDVTVLVNDAASGALVLVDWRKTAGQETRQITLSFKTAPASGAYRVTVFG